MKGYRMEVYCSLIFHDRQTSLLIPFKLKRRVIHPLETFSDTEPTEGVTKQIADNCFLITALPEINIKHHKSHF